MNPIVGIVAPIVNDLIDRFIPNKSEAAKAKAEMEMKLVDSLTQVDVAQIAVNTEEAKHASLFVAGWRPFTGWICSIALAYHFILQPLIAFFLAAFGYSFDLPKFDMDALFTVLMGMLGLGGFRTFEKLKGLTK